VQWSELHNKELNDLYSSPNIIWMIKLGRMGGACSRYRGEVYIGFWWQNLRERDHLEDPGIDGRVTLRWIFRK